MPDDWTRCDVELPPVGVEALTRLAYKVHGEVI